MSNRRFIITGLSGNFSTANTFVVPAGIQQLTVYGCGGGGGGAAGLAGGNLAGGVHGTGGGGGGGAIGRWELFQCSPGETLSVIFGVGGNGGTFVTGGGQPGSAGGASTVVGTLQSLVFEGATGGATCGSTQSAMAAGGQPFGSASFGLSYASSGSPFALTPALNRDFGYLPRAGQGGWGGFTTLDQSSTAWPFMYGGISSAGDPVTNASLITPSTNCNGYPGGDNAGAGGSTTGGNGGGGGWAAGPTLFFNHAGGPGNGGKGGTVGSPIGVSGITAQGFGHGGGGGGGGHSTSNSGAGGNGAVGVICLEY